MNDRTAMCVKAAVGKTSTLGGNWHGLSKTQSPAVTLTMMLMKLSSVLLLRGYAKGILNFFFLFFSLALINLKLRKVSSSITCLVFQRSWISLIVFSVVCHLRHAFITPDKHSWCSLPRKTIPRKRNRIILF